MAHTKEMEAVANDIREEIISQFQAIVGNDNLILEEEARHEYSHDKTEDYSFMPDVVLKPGNTQEVSALLKICNAHHLPTTPRGAGTGLSGGALPVKKGVIISMERFNKILQIDDFHSFKLFHFHLCKTTQRTASGTYSPPSAARPSMTACSKLTRASPRVLRYCMPDAARGVCPRLAATCAPLMDGADNPKKSNT